MKKTKICTAIALAATAAACNQQAMDERVETVEACVIHPESMSKTCALSQEEQDAVIMQRAERMAMAEKTSESITIDGVIHYRYSDGTIRPN